MNVFLHPNRKKDPRFMVSQRAASLLHGCGAGVFLPEELRGVVSLPWAEFWPEGEGYAAADAILTVGGDGTILHAAKGCLAYAKPILGINVGRTGFLATCEVSEIDEKLPRLVRGDFSIEKRSLLCAEVGGQPLSNALNDIVLFSDNHCQTMDFSIYCDDILVSACRSDGVIIATPTGSTAYSLSAGGPILDSRIAGFVVNAICAHSLKNPPIVFSADRKISVNAEGRGGTKAFVCCDGGSPVELKPDHKLCVEFSPQRLQLISFSSAEQFEAIDKKLKGR